MAFPLQRSDQQASNLASSNIRTEALLTESAPSPSHLPPPISRYSTNSYLHQLEQFIFGLIYALVYKNTMNPVIAFLFILLDYLQLLSFALLPSLPWGSPILQEFLFLLQLNTDPHVITFLIFYFLAAVVVAAALLDAGYVGASFRSGRFDRLWPIKILRIIVTLVVTVLYIPLLKILLGMTLCFPSERGLMMAAAIPYTCGSALHIVATLFSVLLSIVFVLFTFISALTYYDPSPIAKGHRSKSSPISKTSGMVEFVLVGFKTIIVVLNLYFPLLHIPRTVALLLGALIMVYIYSRRLPHFAHLTNRFRAALYAGVCCGAVWAFVVIAINDASNPTGLIGFFITIIPFSVMGSFGPVLGRFYIKHYVLRPWKTLFVTGSTQQSTQPAPRGRHFNLPQPELEQGDGLEDPSELNITEPFEFELCAREIIAAGHLHKARDLFEYSAIRFPNSARATIDHASFLVYRLKMHSHAMRLVEEAQTQQPTFEIRFAIAYRVRELQQRIKAETMAGGGSAMDLMSFVETEKYMKQAHKSHIETLEQMKAFWLILLEDDGNIRQMPIAARRISECEIKASKAFAKLIELFPKNVSVLRSYGLFLEEVKFDSEAANNLYHRADTLETLDRSSQKVEIRDASDSSDEDIFPTGFSSPSPLTSRRGSPEVRFGRDSESPSEGRSVASAFSDHSQVDQKKSLEFRKKLEHRKSTSVNLLRKTIILALFLFGVVAITLFLIGISQFESVSEKLLSLSSIGSLQSLALEGTVTTFSVALAFQNRDPFQVSAPVYQTQLKNIMDELSQTQTMAYQAAAFSQDSALTASWQSSTVVCPMATSNSEMNLIETGQRFIMHCRNVAAFESAEQAVSFHEDPHFVIKNGPHCVLEAFETAVHNYEKGNDRLLVQGSAIGIVFLALTLLSLIALVLLLFRPAFRKIGDERLNTLGLFQLIPKHVVARLYKKIRTDTYSFDKDSDDERAPDDAPDDTEQDFAHSHGGDVQEGVEDNLRRLTFQYYLALLLIFCNFMALVLFFIFSEISQLSHGREIAVASQRSMLSYKLYLDSKTMVTDDLEFTTREQLYKTVREDAHWMRKTHFALLYGDEDFDLPSPRHLTAAQSSYMFGDGCLLQADLCDTESAEMRHITRHGLDSAILEYIEQVELLLGEWKVFGANITQHNSTRYGIIATLAEGALANGLSVAVDQIVENASDQKSLDGTVLVLLFVSNLALLFLLYIFLFRRMLAKLYDEDKRTMAMLLMIPADTIKNVDVIREHIERIMTGSTDLVLKKTQTSGIEEVVWQGLREGLVRIDDKGTITSVNDPARQMLSMKKIIGSPFTNYLVEEERLWFLQTLARMKQRAKRKKHRENLIHEDHIAILHNSKTDLRVAVLPGGSFSLYLRPPPMQMPDMLPTLQGVLVHVPLPACLFDDSGVILVVNKQMRSILSVSSAELIGSRIDSVMVGIREPWIQNDAVMIHGTFVDVNIVTVGFGDNALFMLRIVQGEERVKQREPEVPPSPSIRKASRLR